MPEITVQKIKDPVKQALPVFADLERRFDAVRQRAHEMFLNRGRVDRASDDWFAAEHELFGWSAAELSEKDDTYEIDFSLAGFRRQGYSSDCDTERNHRTRGDQGDP